MAEPELTKITAGHRVITPNRVLGILIAVVLFLFLGDQFQWFGFNKLKGWPVLMALACLAFGVLFFSVWYAASRVVHWPFRFGLRWLMIFTAVIGATLAWFAIELRHAKRQHVIITEIENSGGEVLYAWEIGVANARPPAPTWLCNFLGVDFFSNPYGIEAGTGSADDLFGESNWTCTDDDLARKAVFE